jgi:hypothetical protein
VIPSLQKWLKFVHYVHSVHTFQGICSRFAAAIDWAHWHGFFDLMQDIYKLEDIYEMRIETGEIE